MQPDVLVIGAGVVGLAAAAALAKRREVIVLEAEGTQDVLVVDDRVDEGLDGRRRGHVTCRPPISLEVGEDRLRGLGRAEPLDLAGTDEVPEGVAERRAAGMTASAWKTSAGAAARVPVAQATNLTRALEDYRKAGLFVVGLDMDGDVALPGLELASGPLVVVVGSEGKGLSRLVAQTCDQIVSIPMSAATESLNAGMAAAVTLYEVARLRAQER